MVQARDVRLRPRLRKACSEEMAAFCQDVAPGARCCQCAAGALATPMSHALASPLPTLHWFSPLCLAALMQQPVGGHAP